MSSWHPVKDRHRLAVAIYHFNPNQEVAENKKEETQESAQDEEGDEDEAALENGSSSKHPVQFWRLQLTVGDLVVVREEYDQWYFGHLQNNPGLLGIFPKSFVSTEVGDESKSPPIVKEISAMLREWNFYFRDRFLHGDTEVLSLLKAIMKEVIIMRTSLIGMKMTREEVKETQRKVTTKMDFLNHRLGLDLVVRDPEGNILSPEQTSSVALYRQHVQGSEEIKNMMITKPREESETSNTFEIMMNVKNFVSSKVLEDVDLILSIYEVSEPTKVPKPLCENYIVENWRRNPVDPKDMEKRNSLRVLFADISKNDITNKKIFLICNVVAEGNFSGKNASDHLTIDRKIAKSGSKNDLRGKGAKEVVLFRKPVGVAAVEITELFTFKQGKTSEVGRENEVSAPFLASGENEPFESVFRKLVFERKGGENKSLWVTLNIMMADISLESSNKRRHHENIARARKIGLPEVILPSDYRNDLYVTLVSGELSRLDKRSDRNVEVSIEVCNDQGIPIPESISGGVGVATGDVFKSVVFYHESRPKWQEVTKVMIPVDMFTGSHLRFLFRHRSRNVSKENSAPWAMAFLKLVQERDKTALCDGSHDLLVFKIEKRFEFETGSYLSMPYLKSDMYHMKQKTMNNLTLLPKDSFVVHTTLCSTKLTQNEGLLSLLKWRDEPEKLNGILDIFNQKVNGKEFVKFLPDVLDALFSILTEKCDNEQDDEKVFKSLINVINLITEDSRYHQFVRVLDMYIRDNFSATLAYNKLLLVLKECIDDSTLKPKELIQAMKSLKYIFKFVVQSRTLFSKLNGGKGREPFEKSLKDVLQSLVKLMFSTTQDLYQGQAYCLKHMVQSIPDLITVFNRKELAVIIIRMISSLPKGQLSEHKISTLKDLVQSPLFQHAECRAVLIPEFAAKVADLLENADENCQALVTICTEALGDVLDALYSIGDQGAVFDDVNTIVQSCLRTVIQSVANRQNGDTNVRAVVANMISMFRNMTAQHFSAYIDRFNVQDPAGRLDLVDFIMEVLGMFRDLVQNNVFPSDWVSMLLLQNSILLKALKHFANTIRDYLKEPFERQAWGNFFQCAVTFITQPSLQLEKFSENKRQKIYYMYKDMRKEMGKIVKSMWFNLGQHKIRFVPEMVGPFLEMTLIPETELRKDTIPIFFDMMQCEYYSSRFRSDDAGHVLDTKRDPSSTRSNFREFEKEMIEKLDTMIEGGAGDEHYKALFREIMMTPCESHTALRDSGIKLINLVTKLLELLLEYRTITQEESKENQMSCIVNLLDFYQSKNYDNLYIKYLRRLCKLHEVCENWAEAGFTLLQYSETLRWSNEPLKTYWNKRKKYRTHRELKEQLYREVLAHFVRGKMWEQAIEISKELVVQYEEETFEYAKLTELHQKMASFYQSIMTDLRLDPEYFRVAFYGRGFPAFLQNKIFVYRGKGFEKLPEFKARILDQFPNAEVMKTLGAPTEEEKQNPVQLLQINKVDAVMGETKFVGKFVQKQILDYYKFNNVNRFIFSRPFNKGKDKENEFASLWIERTVMQTKSTFPGILQWFALSQDEEIYELCPLENAVETMQRANEELRSLILEHQDQNPPLNPLSMKLNGIIDAAVMGGTAKYEQAFFTDQYIEEHPEHAEKIQVLKNLIAEQVPLLENGIKIHQYKKTEDLKPLHDRLETMFDTMRSQVEEKYGRRSCDITVTRGGIGNDGRGHLRKGSSQMMEVRGSRQHQPMPNGDHRLSAFSHGGEVRASLNSQTSIDSTSKPRMLSAFGIGISRKKSNASRGDDPSRSSLTRSSHSSSVILENGFDDLQASPSSSSGNHHPSSSSPLTPSVYVTQNPTCRLLAPSIPSPSHSRSPSITSNRESVGDVDPPPPVLPPKHHLHHRVTLTSDSENMSLSSFDATDNGEAPNDRGEELIPAKQIFINVKKKPPPPPPPGLGSATPPTPPKKPPFKPPE